MKFLEYFNFLNNYFSDVLDWKMFLLLLIPFLLLSYIVFFAMYVLSALSILYVCSLIRRIKKFFKSNKVNIKKDSENEIEEYEERIAQW